MGRATRRWGAMVAAGGLIVALIVAGGGRHTRPDGAADCVGAATATAAGEVRIVAGEFCFAPANLTLPANRPVTLVLDNRGAAEHDFAVPALGIHLAAAPGRTDRATVTADEPGRYAADCTLPGHAWMGMQATVTVT